MTELSKRPKLYCLSITLQKVCIKSEASIIYSLYLPNYFDFVLAFHCFCLPLKIYLQRKIIQQSTIKRNKDLISANDFESLCKVSNNPCVWAIVEQDMVKPSRVNASV